MDSRLLFVDTNVFLRYLTDDIPERASAAEALFKGAANGEVRLLTTSMVIAEVVWVLESFYHLGKTEVAERALAIVLMDGLTLDEVDLLTDALTVYETANIDFIDAYNACWMKQRRLSRVATFDENHFARVDWVAIERLEY